MIFSYPDPSSPENKKQKKKTQKISLFVERKTDEIKKILTEK